jgi:hypothetical protein
VPKFACEAGLPDALFSDQKSQFGYILEGLAMEDVCILSDIWSMYGHLIYFMDIWYRYSVVIWYIFPRFGLLFQEESGNPE